eukprot:scaffold3806_cov169-Amphora_coffeaeformis.AAC.19
MKRINKEKCGIKGRRRRTRDKDPRTRMMIMLMDEEEEEKVERGWRISVVVCWPRAKRAPSMTMCEMQEGRNSENDRFEKRH